MTQNSEQEKTQEKWIVLAAGGTGGHLFPAESLSAILKERGYKIILATDDRVSSLSESFPADKIVTFSSSSPSSGSFFKKISAIISLGRGILEARSYLKAQQPVAIIGFGGYPSVPPVFAATLLKIPSFIHEQNAVMGRANKMLASRVSVIATGFPKVTNIANHLYGKVIHTGNPVRPNVRLAAETPYPEISKNTDLNILIFGGSQGARVMSDIVPDALASISEEDRKKLNIAQQARPEDVERVTSHYKALGIRSNVQSFFKDLPLHMASSHLIISRAGASTIAELAAIGRPSILVPLPGALDQDQALNAEVLASQKAATIILQKDFTAQRLAKEISKILDHPETLIEEAEAAKRLGILNAAEKLADCITSYLNKK